MAPVIEIKIDDSPFRAALKGLAAAGADLSPALRAIGAAMVTTTKLRFTAGQGPGGVAWKPSKRALKEGGKTLILSGRLWHSITYNASATMVEWGTNVIYAVIHQLGGIIKRSPRTHTTYHKAGPDGIAPGFVKKSRSNFARDVLMKAYNINMPARPFLGVDLADAAEIKSILSGFLTRVAEGGAS